MKIFLWILLGLLALYLLFVLLPSLLSFFYSYGGREGKDLDREPLSRLQKSQYKDLLPVIFQGNRWYREIFPQMSEHTIRSYDGLKLMAHYLDQGFSRTAVLMHGFHTTIGNNFGVIGQDLLALGFNLLFPDQRCFGGSEGVFCSFGQREHRDLLRWIEYADRDLHAEEILVFGVSMGGVAVSFASGRIENPKVKLLVDDCAFTSIYELQMQSAKNFHVPGKIMMPYVERFARWFIGIDIRKSTESSLKNARIPMFFIHGGADKSVPLEWGIRNYNACSSEKEQMIEQDAGHAVAYVASGAEGKERLRRLVQKYFSEPKGEETA